MSVQENARRTWRTHVNGTCMAAVPCFARVELWKASLQVIAPYPPWNTHFLRFQHTPGLAPGPPYLLYIVFLLVNKSNFFFRFAK
jgi:hypothetical protein